MRSALEQAPGGSRRRRWGFEVAAAVLALIATLTVALPRLLTLQTHSIVTSPSNDYRIAIAPREPHLLTILDGTLNAQVNSDGTACLWMSAQKSSTAVFWPTGFSARGNPVVLYDDKGARVAAAGDKLKVGAGQVRSTDARPVLGCTGLSQYVVGGPLLPPPQAPLGKEIYSDRQMQQMGQIVDANRDVFGPFLGDWSTHLVTITIASKAGKDRVAAARAALNAVGASSDPKLDFAKQWRVGFLTTGPSLAELDEVKSQVTTAEPWVKDTADHLTMWGIDPVYRAVAVGLDLITPTISQEAVSTFGTLAILRTEGRAAPA
jgi:hypothetical protein